MESTLAEEPVKCENSANRVDIVVPMVSDVFLQRSHLVPLCACTLDHSVGTCNSK